MQRADASDGQPASAIESVQLVAEYCDHLCISLVLTSGILSSSAEDLFTWLFVFRGIIWLRIVVWVVLFHEVHDACGQNLCQDRRQLNSAIQYLAAIKRNYQ